jgi:hypothetical protein
MKYVLLIVSLLIANNVFAQTWQRLGFDSLNVFSVYANRDTVWVGVQESTGERLISMYKSSTAGQTWERLVFPDTLGEMVLLGVHPHNSRVVFAADRGIRNRRLLKSTDFGASWHVSFDPLTVTGGLHVVQVYFSPFNADKMYIRLWRNDGQRIIEGFYCTTNGGTTWQFASNGIAIWSHGVTVEMAFHATDSTKAFATSETIVAHFYHGIVGSGAWNAIWQTNSWQGISRMWFLKSPDGNQNIGLSGLSLRTTDDGVTWVNTNFAYGGAELCTDSRYPGLVIAVCGNSRGLYQSNDAGLTSFQIPDSQNRNFNGSFYFVGENDFYGSRTLSLDGVRNRLYAGSWSGLFRYNAPVSSTSKETPAPKKFELLQNYPNPFNPTTTIAYELPKATEVRLEVYDMLGRQVSTLVNERQASGRYQVPFNAASLSSGTYFYQLQTSEGRQTRKMTLIK